MVKNVNNFRSFCVPRSTITETTKSEREIKIALLDSDTATVCDMVGAGGIVSATDNSPLCGTASDTTAPCGTATSASAASNTTALLV